MDKSRNVENKMVVDWVWIELERVVDSNPPCVCDVCGKRYRPRTRGDWDWICPECAEKARKHAVEVLKKNLSKEEYSVVEDLWEIYAGV